MFYWRLSSFNPFNSDMALLGIDLGGTKLASAVFTEDGSMISEETVLVGDRRGRRCGELIASG